MCVSYEHSCRDFSGQANLSALTTTPPRVIHGEPKPCCQSVVKGRGRDMPGGARSRRPPPPEKGAARRGRLIAREFLPGASFLRFRHTQAWSPPPTAKLD